MTSLSRVGVATLLLGLAASAGQAQSSSSQATAAVVTPLSVTGLAPLNFGVVFQGVAKTIAYNNAASGRLSLAGFNTSQVSMTFTLPTTLSSGGSSMPINTYRVRVNGVNSTAGAVRIAVVSGVPVARNLVAGNLFVFVGGRVQPAAAQPGGTYTGAIVLQAAYTGL
jgi:hypothetical protein